MEREYKQQREQLGFLPFDPLVLVRDVARRWLLILLVVVLVGTGTYIWSDIRYTPAYKTTTTFVVTSKSSSATIFGNLTAANSLAAVFGDLLNSSLMRTQILQQLGTDRFDGTIKAGVIAETNLLTVTVTDSDPRMTFLVARAIIDYHHLVTDQVVDGLTLEVLQNPAVPVAPANPADATGNMRKAMLLTAVVMCLLLAVLSYCRDTVRSSKEAGAKLDCQLLGEIPHEEKYKTLPQRLHRRKTSILITNPIVSFRYVETMRKLRHRVQQHMHGDKVLMVTSLLENEGKSTVAVNLALSMARKQQKVLLLDCDLRKPACARLLEFRDFGLGVKDVLSGWAAPEDAVVQEPGTGMYLLLEKRSTKASGDYVASEHFRELLAWARREFDFVVVDLPPMGAVSDAESVMEQADASLLVVRQNMAVASALNKAVATLDTGKARLLGCVLNDVYTMRLPAGGYGKYGHYGHYGHYGAYGHYAQRPADEQEG